MTITATPITATPITAEQHSLTKALVAQLDSYGMDDIWLESMTHHTHFTNAEEAWHALQDLVALLESPDRDYSIAKGRFYRANIAELYLREAPEYRLFWMMLLPQRVHDALHTRLYAMNGIHLSQHALDLAKSHKLGFNEQIPLHIGIV